jgi:quinohemoprotein ethanol dehydrogenase
VLATSGNLVFQGQIDGTFNAYAADSGKPVWSYPAQAPVIAPPITYAVRGKQYVTVLTGFGTSAGAFGPLLPVSIDYRTQARRVLTFALDGTATLPKSEPVVVAPADDPDYKVDDAGADRGKDIYARRCATCHGVATIAAGAGPDLRASPIPSSPDALTSVVRDGLLVPAGMPRFEELTDEEVRDISQYIRSRAKAMTPAK